MCPAPPSCTSLPHSFVTIILWHRSSTPTVIYLLSDFATVLFSLFPLTDSAAASLSLNVSPHWKDSHLFHLHGSDSAAHTHSGLILKDVRISTSTWHSENNLTVTRACFKKKIPKTHFTSCYREFSPFTVPCIPVLTWRNVLPRPKLRDACEFKDVGRSWSSSWRCQC